MHTALNKHRKWSSIPPLYMLVDPLPPLSPYSGVTVALNWSSLHILFMMMHPKHSLSIQSEFLNIYKDQNPSCYNNALSKNLYHGRWRLVFLLSIFLMFYIIIFICKYLFIFLSLFFVSKYRFPYLSTCSLNHYHSFCYCT